MINSHFTSCFSPPSSASPPMQPEPLSTVSSISSVDFAGLDVIGSMRSNVASGPDGISSMMLKGVLTLSLLL